MKKIKHSKFRNAGILFELLVRQITSDILEGKDDSKAQRLLKKYFSTTSDLGKESRLYQIVLKERVKNDHAAEKIIEAIVASRKKLSSLNLKRQKYELIKEIKNTYDIKDFLRGSVGDYKILASLYKIFESAVSQENYDPQEVYTSQNCLLEHLCGKRPKNKDEKEQDEVISNYKKQENDLRLLSYRLLVDSFNKKYKSVLSEGQKGLLREYINNVSNTNPLRVYINKEADKAKIELAGLAEKVTDPIVRIKLKEVTALLENVKRGTVVKDNQVTGMMMIYQLIKEIKEALTNEKVPA